ncbi:TraR/DksA C4-type zinc finger protein [Streptomyces smyrnaeus]|uniref:TraR/DksA C4-type zinc finger protein n=1 Tax=Streptomyces smyrnaeus TaxID=1387713 RepID=A0ABS3Y731_9ACTN|nr:TraR/DksA C4-type zinc finger protein [Streptomyces smyrnaeus]MBO8203447.1 TraR/DksA C4-type zinc finger protein [Streptomyces smyrnaeus]
MVNHQTIGERATQLSPQDLTALLADLHEQRLFRRSQLQQLQLDAVPSARDRRRHRPESQRAARVAAAVSARMILSDVEAALRRISEGRYGTCQLCRRPVDRERLMIVPQARYCARCQQVRRAGQ